MAWTFFGTQSASFAKIEVKFVFSPRRRYLNGIVRAVHIAIAAIETEPATKTALSLPGNFFAIKGRVNLSEILQPHMDRDRFLTESFCLLIIVSV
jgi:hypothetical protein